MDDRGGNDRQQGVVSKLWTSQRASAQLLSANAARSALGRGEPVQCQLRVRRFRCQNDLCQRVTFAERLPAVVGWHEQRTLRLTTSRVHLVMTMSAEAGARLLPHLGMKTSADTLLQILRQQAPHRPSHHA